MVPGVAAVTSLLVAGLAVILLGQREQGARTVPVRYLMAAAVWSAAAVWLAGGWLPLGELRWGLATLGAFGILVATFANEAVAARMGAGQSNRLEAAEGMAASRRAGLFALMVVVAPVFEELLFRGLLFGLLERFGLSVTLLVTSVVFALSHFDRRSFAGLFVCGLIFAALRAVSGGLATPLLAHALANGFGFAMFMLQSRGGERSSESSGEKSDESAEAKQLPRSASGHSAYEEERP